jgi:hypothetical protein
MSRSDSTRRLIAALLLFFFLGLQLTSARSTSHEHLPHAHLASSASHAGDHAGDHDDGGHGGHLKRYSHVHDHNPNDHTHDLALRPTMQPLVTPPPCGWQQCLHNMPAVIHPLPLERPPKPLAA